MMLWLQRAVGVLLSIVIVLMAPAPLYAQEDDDDDTEEVEEAEEPTDEELAAARALFSEAKDLEAAGEWAKALTKLEKVAKVVTTPQVRFHVALCHENLGRLVEAINGFELAAQEAEKTGATDVLENAPKRAEALRARVAYLVLEVSGKVRVSKIYLDDRRVSIALAGTKIPVDPGEHRVEVRREGEVTYDMDVELAEGETHKLEIEIDDPAPKEDPDPKPDPKPDPDIKTPPETEMKRLPAYILAGVGVVSFITAGVFWGLRETTVSNIAANCEDADSLTGCDPDDRELEDIAQTYDVTSKVMLGIGAVSLASGVALWFILAPEDGTPTTGKKKKKVSVAPTIGGVVVSGAF